MANRGCNYCGAVGPCRPITLSYPIYGGDDGETVVGYDEADEPCPCARCLHPKEYDAWKAGDPAQVAFYGPYENWLRRQR